MARLARWFYPGFGAGSAQTPAQLMAARETKRGGETPGAGAAVITRTRTQTKASEHVSRAVAQRRLHADGIRDFNLQAFFNKDAQEATQIMLQVHNTGVGECGVYTYEIAETKVSQVMDHASSGM